MCCICVFFTNGKLNFTQTQFLQWGIKLASGAVMARYMAQLPRDRVPAGWEDHVEDDDGEENKQNEEIERNENENREAVMRELVGKMVLYAYRRGNIEFGGALEHFVADSFNIESRTELWTALQIHPPHIPNRHPEDDSIPSLPPINGLEPLPLMGDAVNNDNQLNE